VSKVVVHKSSEASLVEGGVAGSVDIITRKPLDFKDPFSFQASAGGVYADLPSKADPQASALLNWHDADRSVGVLLQGFYERRHLRRDGVELLGYEQIAPGSPIANAHPDLTNVWYPKDIGSALFEQTRERTGGLIDIQFKPSDSVNLDLSGFASRLDAPNFNRNYLVWSTNFINVGKGQSPNAGYVVQNGTLTQATFTGAAGTNYGVYDQISRPNESASSNFLNLDGDFRLSEHLTLAAQAGTSEGHGKTPTQDVSETSPGTGNGASWQLQGISSGPNFGLGATNYTQPFPTGNPQSLTFGWIFGAQAIDIVDKENWGKLDANYALPDMGVWKDLKFGARYVKHDRTSDSSINQGPTFSGPPPTILGGTDPLHYPTTFTNYPSNFNTFGGNIPTGVWFWTPAQLAVYDGTGFTQRGALPRQYYQFLFQLHESDAAGYVQADFKGTGWAGNLGLRYVQTKEDATTYTQVPANTPGAITTSLFGPFIGIPVKNTYNDVLPSANLKLDVSKDLVGRFAVAETMTRADYSALAGFTDLSQPADPHNIGGGSGGNPFLKPIRSVNYDAGLEWYFAPRSLLSGTLFYMDLRNYIGFGPFTLLHDLRSGAAVPRWRRLGTV
jgi:iron complex outermembrane receptor protein